jgi:hypothetical protein
LNERSLLLRYLLISFALLLNACEAAPPDTSAVPQFTSSEAKKANANASANASVETAYAKKLSDVQVSGHGVVTKLLPDDQKGARHQKFLVRINPEQTLLFAHNIDLAERLPLQIGDTVSFNGEYVYNPKGGIVHWTHLDPQGNHTPGWILLQGKKYQ